MAGCLRPRQGVGINRIALLASLLAGALVFAQPNPNSQSPSNSNRASASNSRLQLNLVQINQRLPGPDFAPVFQGRKVVTQGVVNSPAMHFPEYSALAIQDKAAGAILTSPAPGAELDGFMPGNEIRVVGVVALHMGMAVIEPETIELIGQQAAPAPAAVPLRDLQGFRYLGRLVRASGRVASTTQTLSGPAITFEGADPVRVFLPREQNQAIGDFGSFDNGDLVEVTGVAAQYCPRPPYNRSFELLAPSPQSVVRKERALGLPIIAVGLGLTMILIIGFVFWNRERRMRGQRERLRNTYQLGEEILGASSPEAVWTRIAETLPSILGITRVHLYVHNRAAKTLDGVAEQAGESVSILLSARWRGRNRAPRHAFTTARCW